MTQTDLDEAPLSDQEAASLRSVAVCMDCPSQDGCLFFNSFCNSENVAAQKIIQNYTAASGAWKDCVRLYIQNRHGIVLPHDFGPHGKSIS